MYCRECNVVREEVLNLINTSCISTHSIEMYKLKDTNILLHFITITRTSTNSIMSLRVSYILYT